MNPSYWIIQLRQRTGVPPWGATDQPDSWCPSPLLFDMPMTSRIR